MTVRPRTDGDRQTLQQALSDLAQQDPNIRISAGSDGQTIIGGMSELHMESIRERILHEHQIDADVGTPRVIYLETIRKRAVAEGEFIYRYGSQRRFYGRVQLRLEPIGAGGGYQFVNRVTDGLLSPEFAESVNLAIQDAMKAGILAGQEIVDLRAVLYGGGNHPDSNESAFRIAASIAFKEAVRKASPVVLEPIMAVEIEGPEEYLDVSGIIGDLKSRRGRISGLEHYDNSLKLRAIVPMAEMLGYASYLRSITQGRAEYSMRLIRYAEALPSGESGGDEAGLPAIKPEDPKPGSGGDESGVFAIKPKGPKPKSRSAAAKPEAESE